MTEYTQDYKEWRLMAEKATGCEMRTPKDFALLAARIFARTNVLVSATTLKRLWGYIDKGEQKHNMRRSTLNALAMYVGYCDWDAFCNRETNENKDSSHLFYDAKHITTEKLTPGDVMVVMWNPNRCVTLRYSGSNMFVVIANENSKLSVGDTFRCNVFIENQQLIIVDLVHDGLPPCGYVCGKHGGIKFYIQDNKQ